VPNQRPAPIRLDPAELTEFCRTYEATRGKVKAACDDALEVRYADLLMHYQDTMQKVFEFLELPPRPEMAPPVVPPAAQRRGPGAGDEPRRGPGGGALRRPDSDRRG
jgi:hypothetical protein